MMEVNYFARLKIRNPPIVMPALSVPTPMHSQPWARLICQLVDLPIHYSTSWKEFWEARFKFTLV